MRFFKILFCYCSGMLMLRCHFTIFLLAASARHWDTYNESFQRISSARISFLFQSGQNKTHLKNPRRGQKCWHFKCLPGSKNLMPMLLFIPTAPEYISHVPFKDNFCHCKQCSWCLVALCQCRVLIIDGIPEHSFLSCYFSWLLPFRCCW